MKTRSFFSSTVRWSLAIVCGIAIVGALLVLPSVSVLAITKRDSSQATPAVERVIHVEKKDGATTYIAQLVTHEVVDFVDSETDGKWDTVAFHPTQFEPRKTYSNGESFYSPWKSVRGTDEIFQEVVKKTTEK